MNTSESHVIKLEKRQLALLEIIDSFSSTLEHPTSGLLHEYVLLCRLRARDVPQFRDYAFHAYIRGPFSEGLRADLEALTNSGLIESHEGLLKLTSEAEKLMEKCRGEENLSSVRGECDKVLREFGSAYSISEGIRASVSDTRLGEALTLP